MNNKFFIRENINIFGYLGARGGGGGGGLQYSCNELGGGQRRLDSGATGVGRSGSHKEITDTLR